MAIAYIFHGFELQIIIEGSWLLLLTYVLIHALKETPLAIRKFKVHL